MAIPPTPNYTNHKLILAIKNTPDNTNLMLHLRINKNANEIHQTLLFLRGTKRTIRKSLGFSVWCKNEVEAESFDITAQ